MKRILVLFSIFYLSFNCSAQLDSIARNLYDTIKGKLIIEEIPKEKFTDILMYPNRWYARRVLAPKVPYYDTTYIKSNKRRLTLTMPLTKKFYGFNITDLEKNRKLKFSPNTYYTVGIHISNIIASFGFSPGLKFGAKSDKGKTKSRDYQLTVIGRRVITDLNYQRYRGFYVYNTNDFITGAAGNDTTLVRPDVNVTSFGINSNFVFNNKKYSLRGGFSFSDIQLKSAGSFMAGIYHSHLVFSSNDSTFIKSGLISSFSPLLSKINQISEISAGVSCGYGYTFVYKKLIFSIIANVGVGGQKTYFRTMEDDGESLKLNLATHVTAKNALRYDNLRFFVGVLASYEGNFAFNTKVFNNEKYIARVVCFTGYRFNLKNNGRRFFRALSLVDYDKVRPKKEKPTQKKK